MEFSAHWVFCTYYQFLVLAGKGPTAYVHLEMISNCSSSSFYSASGDWG